MLSTGAVLFPAVVLCVLEYRSLVQLDAKTRSAAHAELLRAVENVTGRVEAGIRRIGEDALSSFVAADARRSVAELGSRFDGVQRAHPDIEQVFLFTLDDASGLAAVLSGPDGAQKYT